MALDCAAAGVQATERKTLAATAPKNCHVPRPNGWLRGRHFQNQGTGSKLLLLAIVLPEALTG